MLRCHYNELVWSSGSLNLTSLCWKPPSTLYHQTRILNKIHLMGLHQLYFSPLENHIYQQNKGIFNPGKLLPSNIMRTSDGATFVFSCRITNISKIVLLVLPATAELATNPATASSTPRPPARPHPDDRRRIDSGNPGQEQRLAPGESRIPVGKPKESATWLALIKFAL